MGFAKSLQSCCSLPMAAVVASHFVDFLSAVVRKKRGYVWLLRRIGDYVSCLLPAAAPLQTEPVSQCLPFAVCFSQVACLCVNSQVGCMLCTKGPVCQQLRGGFRARNHTTCLCFFFMFSLTSAKLRTDTEQRRDEEPPPPGCGKCRQYRAEVQT